MIKNFPLVCYVMYVLSYFKLDCVYSSSLYLQYFFHEDTTVNVPKLQISTNIYIFFL